MAFMALVTAFLLGVSGINYGFGASKQEAGSENSATTYVSETSTAQSDEQTSKVIREGDQVKQSDKLASEGRSDKQLDLTSEQRKERSRFWLAWLKERSYWRPGDWDLGKDCEKACDLAAVLLGPAGSRSLCGALDVRQINDASPYAKCAGPDADSTEDLANQCSKAELLSLVDVLVNKVDVNNGVFDRKELREVLKRELTRRAHAHGLGMRPFLESTIDENLSDDVDVRSVAFASGLWASLRWKLYQIRMWLSYYVHGLSYITQSSFTELLFKQSLSDSTHVVVGRKLRCPEISRRTEPYSVGLNPFCEANKDYPLCREFLAIIDTCERLLAESPGKS